MTRTSDFRPTSHFAVLALTPQPTVHIYRYVYVGLCMSDNLYPARLKQRHRCAAVSNKQKCLQCPYETFSGQVDWAQRGWKAVPNPMTYSIWPKAYDRISVQPCRAILSSSVSKRYSTRRLLWLSWHQKLPNSVTQCITPFKFQSHSSHRFHYTSRYGLPVIKWIIL